MCRSNSLYSNLKIFDASAQYSLGYYPNTRTNIQGTAGQRVITQSDAGYEYGRYIAYLNVSVNYYFSPYLRATGDCSLNFDQYYSKDSYKNNGFKALFNARLIYFIF